MTTKLQKGRRSDLEAPETGEIESPSEAVKLALRLTGAAQAFQFMGATSEFGLTAALKQVYESAAYKRLGHTWKSYLSEVVGVPHQRVAENFKNLEAFGSEFLQVNDTLQLGRATLRGLRNLPEDQRPRVDGDMMQIGEVRVPLHATDRLQTILEEILATQAELQQHMATGRAQLDQREDQIKELEQDREQAAKEREETEKEHAAAVRKLQTEIKALRNPPKPMDLVSDFDRCCTVILDHMNRAVNMIQAEEPGTEPEKVIKWVRTWGQLHGFMTQYGANWTPVTELDPEMFDAENAEAIMREIEEG